MSASSSREAELVLSADAVQLYNVEGETRTLVATDELKVLETTVTDEEKAAADLPEDSPNKIMLLTIGEATLALVPQIPTLRIERRNYMIAQTDGKFVAVLFPHDVDDEIITEFENLLEEHTSYKITGRDGKVVAVADKAATGIAAGSQYIVKGIEESAKAAIKGIRFATGFLKAKIKPKEEAVHVNENVMAQAQKAKFVTATAVTVTQGLVNGVVAMSSEMAKTLATGINKTSYGQKLQGSQGPKVKAAKKVAFEIGASALQIYEAMQMAGKAIVVEAAGGGAQVIGHRYGAEAEQLARTGGAAVGNVAQAALNVKDIGVKAVVKKTVVATAKEVGKGPSEEKGPKNPYEDLD